MFEERSNPLLCTMAAPNRPNGLEIFLEKIRLNKITPPPEAQKHPSRKYSKEFLLRINREHSDRIQMPKIFNDYYNCMNGNIWEPERYFNLIQFENDPPRKSYKNFYRKNRNQEATNHELAAKPGLESTKKSDKNAENEKVTKDSNENDKQELSTEKIDEKLTTPLIDQKPSPPNNTSNILNKLFSTPKKTTILPVVPKSFTALTVAELESLHFNEERVFKKKLKKLVKAGRNAARLPNETDASDSWESDALLNASFDNNVSSLESSLSQSDATNVLKRLLKIKSTKDQMLAKSSSNEVNPDAERFNLLISKLTSIDEKK